MYRILSFLSFLIVMTAAIGYFRGWFAFETVGTGPDGRTEIRLSVDGSKFDADKNRVKAAATDLKNSFNGDGSSSSTPPARSAREASPYEPANNDFR